MAGCGVSCVQDTYIEEDKDLVASYFELGEDEKLKRMSPWLLRIELNREMMVDKKLTMSDIADRIDREFNDELHCIFSDDNAEKLILRVRAPRLLPCSSVYLQLSGKGALCGQQCYSRVG